MVGSLPGGVASNPMGFPHPLSLEVKDESARWLMFHEYFDAGDSFFLSLFLSLKAEN
jgi:hypothetical protein